MLSQSSAPHEDLLLKLLCGIRSFQFVNEMICVVIGRFLVISHLNFADDTFLEHEQNWNVFQLCVHLVFHLQNLQIWNLFNLKVSILKLVNWIENNCSSDHVGNSEGTVFRWLALLYFLSDSLKVGLQVTCYSVYIDFSEGISNVHLELPTVLKSMLNQELGSIEQAVTF